MCIDTDGLLFQHGRTQNAIANFHDFVDVGRRLRGVEYRYRRHSGRLVPEKPNDR